MVILPYYNDIRVCGVTLPHQCGGTFVLLLVAELQYAKRASEAPLVREIGFTSSRENLVMTSPYGRLCPYRLMVRGRRVSMSPAISVVLNYNMFRVPRGHSHVQIWLNQNQLELMTRMALSSKIRGLSYGISLLVLSKSIY